MFLNVPVAATDIPGPRSIVQEFGGLLVPNTDAGVESALKQISLGSLEHSTFDARAYNGQAFGAAFTALLGDRAYDNCIDRGEQN